MIYVFDIDGTICTKDNDQNYDQSVPLANRILIINKLFDDGNIIIFQTARGMGRHKNNKELANKEFYDMTFKQLELWGVKFHELHLGKPAGDVYVDDKGTKDNDFFTT